MKKKSKWYKKWLGRDVISLFKSYHMSNLIIVNNNITSK
jgi:hypothetical protein